MKRLAETGRVGAQGDGIVLDLLILADSDYFIGHADSAVTRLAYLLMSANKDYTPPAIFKMPVPWSRMGCQNCNYWVKNVKRYNSNQRAEAQEICQDTCQESKENDIKEVSPSAVVRHISRVTDEGSNFWRSTNYRDTRVLRKGIPGLIAYAMRVHVAETARKEMDEIVIHLIGGSDDDEARGNFEYLTDLLPQKRIRIVIVGPHILINHQINRAEPCETCTRYPDKPGAKLVVECWTGLYQDWLAAFPAAKKPDVAFMMNCGILGEMKVFTPNPNPNSNPNPNPTGGNEGFYTYSGLSERQLHRYSCH